MLYEVSPYYPRGNVRIKLSCFSYATFMVKQYDEGQKSAEWLAIVPTEKGAASRCIRSHAVGEGYQIPGVGRLFQRSEGESGFL